MIKVVSTAIGLAIGSLVLISSILLFVSLWNAYFSTYISTMKVYAEKASYLSKAGLNISSVLVKKKKIIIIVKNTGLVPIKIGSNYTFILLKCLGNDKHVKKVHYFHIGSKDIVVEPLVLNPGDEARIVIKKQLGLQQGCTYLEVIIMCSEGLKAVKIVSI